VVGGFPAFGASAVYPTGKATKRCTDFPQFRFPEAECHLFVALVTSFRFSRLTRSAGHLPDDQGDMGDG
jgi:hypothetical protein